MRGQRVILPLLFFVLPAAVLAGSQNIQGGLYDVGTTASDPFSGRCVQERIWSVINQNVVNGATCPTSGTGSCTLGKDPASMACNRGWSSNAANSGHTGYFSHTENMTQFDPVADNYFVYVLWENARNLGTIHAANYYYVTGEQASHLEKGRFQDVNCTGTVALSCFMPGTSSRNAGSIANTRSGSILNQGGLSPVPIPRIVNWDGPRVDLVWPPVQYFDNGDGAPSPFRGYRLYRYEDRTFNQFCNPAPNESNTDWVNVTPDTGGAPGNADDVLTGTSFSDFLPPGVECTQYGLVLVFDGPDNVTSGAYAVTGEITTALRGYASVAYGGGNPLVATATGFEARYAGRNSFKLSWSSGTEGGIAAWRLLRSADADGPFVAAGADTPAQGDGAFYSLLDKVQRKQGRYWYYQLQAVRTDGSVTTVATVAATMPRPAPKSLLGS